MGKNANLHDATRAGDNEFYTQRADIESEMCHYERHFAGKVILCNCDDPEHSEFYKYFSENYDRLRLHGLHTNHFNRETGEGDFRSRKAQALLDRSDIVVTNPPFSIFRQFMAELIDPDYGKPSLLAEMEKPRDKKFIIVGNLLSLNYNSIFPLIKANLLWAGVDNKSKKYLRPNGELKPVNSCWLTNLDHGHRYKDIALPTKFDDMARVKFDNWDAINIDRLKDLPSDYAGEMGVPITFLIHHNPEQFELIHNFDEALVDGEQKFCRIIIRNKRL